MLYLVIALYLMSIYSCFAMLASKSESYRAFIKVAHIFWSIQWTAGIKHEVMEQIPTTWHCPDFK